MSTDTDLANLITKVDAMVALVTLNADPAMGTLAAEVANLQALAGVSGDLQSVVDELPSITGLAALGAPDIQAMIASRSLPLFRAEFPTLPVPARAMTLYDGVSAGDLNVVRATAANTRVTSQRLVEAVPASMARYDHDPETGEPRGVRIETQNTQLLTRSEELDHADWAKNLMTVTADQADGADGALVLDKLVPDAGGTGHRIHQTQSVTSGSDYLFSGYFRHVPGGYDEVELSIHSTGFPSELSAVFDLTDGSVVGTPTASIYGSQHIGGGLYRFWVGGTANSTTTGSFRVLVGNDSTDGVKGVFAGQMMLHEGQFPVSYVKSVDAEVTVDGDMISVDPSAQSWFADGVQEATFFLEVDLDWLRINTDLLTVSDGTTGFRVQCSTGGTKHGGINGSDGAASKNFSIINLGGFLSSSLAFSGVTGAKIRVAVGLDRTSFHASINGQTVKTTTLTTPLPDDLDVLLLGRGTAVPVMVGTVRQMAYWPAKLSDADLVTLATVAA